ncbi:hypothetical protein KC959_00645, partial [Candidatus Saccharibacteria bacterium]|nr:hypothetical protein [Candidatus Saccharibacteria bacterium]
MSVSFKKMPTISKKVSIFLVTLVAVFSTASITRVVRSSALSGSEFQASNIIDDAIFFNSQSMGVDQIQAFLNSKVPVCDTNGSQPIYGTTRAAYGASQGHPAPYTCLKDYTQTIPSLVNSGSDLCGGTISAGTKSAAQIIYDVSRICGINPQVLIVLLQKEQSLITDEWPWDTQYRSATGYGCPDTAPCDSQYYGFFNQVYQAAKAFRRYEANPDSYNYKANRNNFIYYHPSLGSCEGTNVFIQNQATANLYIYTPYQPNNAALNNLYGTGDGCSSYGNRNFWRMFNDWFGSTIAPNGGIQLASSLAVSFPGSTIEQGELVTASFDVTNNSDIYINAGKLGVCGRMDNKWYDFGTDYVYLNGNQTKTITKSKVINTPGKLDLFICSYSYLLGGWASDVYPYNLNGYTRTFTKNVQQNPLLTAGVSLDGAPAVNSLSTVT